MTPDDVAGGLRALANMLEGGLVGHFDDDPRQPVFRQIVTSTRKSMGDNADAIYFDAAVSSRVRVPRARPDRGRGLRVVHGRGGRGRRRVPATHGRRAERHAVRRRRRRRLRDLPRRPAARPQLDRARSRRVDDHDPALLGAGTLARDPADPRRRARRSKWSTTCRRCRRRTDASVAAGLRPGRALRALALARADQARRG